MDAKRNPLIVWCVSRARQRKALNMCIGVGAMRTRVFHAVIGACVPVNVVRLTANAMVAHYFSARKTIHVDHIAAYQCHMPTAFTRGRHVWAKYQL
jgi:hypothetical protein